MRRQGPDHVYDAGAKDEDRASYHRRSAGHCGQRPAIWDAAARGSAQDILLYLWGRGRDDLESHGDDALIDAWGSVTP